MYAVSCCSAGVLPSAFHLIIHSFMGKVKVILYGKDGSKIGKLELESDKDIRGQLLPLKSQLGIYEYEVELSWSQKIMLKMLMLALEPRPCVAPHNVGSESGRIVL